MKMNKLTIAAIAAAVLGVGNAAFAQSPSAPAATPGAATPNEIVYVPQLPSAAELTKAAAAQGVTITQIDLTSSQITVAYKYSNGYVNIVSYQPLSVADPSAAVAPASVPMPTSPPPAAPQATTTVVYAAPAPGYYYAPYPYDYGYNHGWGWYPPIAIGLSFGFHGGGFHGGGRFR